MFDFLSKKFSSLFSVLRAEKRLTESAVDQALLSVRDALIEADVPYDVVEQFALEIKHDVVGKKLIGSLKPDEQLMKLVYDKLVEFLGGSSGGSAATFAFDIPSTVLVMGLQGSGKTTTVAKLAHHIKEAARKRGKERRILVGSVDFYRPAAIDQLEIMAHTAGVAFYRAQSTNPVKAAQEIEQYAHAQGYEIVFIDTAGRLHVDDTMLAELKSIHQLIKPKYNILVLDAMTGQESLSVARAFGDAVGYVGAILTKMDSEARAGCALAFRYVLKKPILFVGTGEKIDDLEPFKAERAAGRMIDMGDLLTLVEKAEEKIGEHEQKKMTAAFETGKLTLQDFADQLAMVSRLGSLSSLMKYVPGVGALSPDMIEQGERELKKFRTIIGSMTPHERVTPKILNASRKQRVARGAGLSVADIDGLLVKFEQSQQFVKLFKKMGRMPQRFS